MTTAAKYTRFVFIWKNVLWLLVAGIIILLVWIASSSNGENGGRVVFTNMPKVEDTPNIMKKPRYQGVDVNNRPYTIDAESAVQKDKETVILDKITGDMTSDSNDWVALKAMSGELNTTSKEIFLSNGVELFYEGGYQFRTERAHVDTAKSIITGDKPIEGQGASGTIRADSFSISEHGNVIKFNGSVRMLLYR